MGHFVPSKSWPSTTTESHCKFVRVQGIRHLKRRLYLKGQAMRKRAAIIERILMVVGLVLLTYASASYLYGTIYQVYLRWTFDTNPLVLHKTDPRGALRAGVPIGKLEVPRLKLTVMVLEGVDDSTLRHGAGHVPETRLPGTSGNVGIAAHRDTFF